MVRAGEAASPLETHEHDTKDAIAGAWPQLVDTDGQFLPYPVITRSVAIWKGCGQKGTVTTGYNVGCSQITHDAWLLS